jgi:hypothetical protein
LIDYLKQVTQVKQQIEHQKLAKPQTKMNLQKEKEK